MEPRLSGLSFGLPTLEEIAKEIDRLEQKCKEMQKVAQFLRELYRSTMRVRRVYGLPLDLNFALGRSEVKGSHSTPTPPTSNGEAKPCN